MPVALAIAATDRSISAVRITKVRPDAMMPVIETWRRMLARLSSVAKDGLGALKNATSTTRVNSGAMLRSWSRGSCLSRPPPWPAVGVSTLHRPPHAAASRRSLLDRLVANSRATVPLLITMMRSARDRTVSGSVESTRTPTPCSLQRLHDADHVLLGADVHAARRLATGSAPGRSVSHLASATFCWLPPERVPQRDLDARRPDRQASTWPSAISFSARGFSSRRRCGSRIADRHVLVDRLLAEQHHAPALRHEGDAGPRAPRPCCGAAPPCRRAQRAARQAPACRTARGPARSGPSP